MDGDSVFRVFLHPSQQFFRKRLKGRFLLQVCRWNRDFMLNEIATVKADFVAHLHIPVPVDIFGFTRVTGGRLFAIITNVVV